MAETTPAPVERSTTRSSAIHSSADLLCKLIGDEVSYAIKPYQDAVLVLQRQLQALSNANPSVYPGAAVILAQSAERSETELSALKAALEECGFGLTLAQDSGKPSLRFVGASATFVSILSAELKAFAPNPEVVQPITPASIVRVLVQGFSDCKRRLDEAHRRYSNSFRERDELKKTLAAAAAREAGDATKWTAERATLEATVREEENKVAALTKAVGLLRSQLQAMAARNNEAADWKDKYQAVEAEREELKNTAYTGQGMLVSLEADLNTWKTKCEKVEADLASAKDESEDNLRKVQAEVNEWKTKFQGVETELKTVTDESDAKLRRAQVDLKLAQDKNEEDLGKVQGEVDEWKNKFHAAEAKLTTATNQSNATLRTTQAELDDWKDKCLALEAELKIEAKKMRVDLETVQSEMETWKTRSLAAEVERDSAQTALRDATAQIPSDADTAKTDLAAWEAKAAAWDAERKRHKNQTARNAALISQFQVDVPKLEAKLHDAESERDKLKETLQAENTQALAKNNALTAELEELKKMYAAQAAPTSPSKASSSIFIKPRQQPLRTPLPEKPPSQASPSSASPRVPASTIASPIALGALRRKSFSTPSASASSSSAPPPERTTDQIPGLGPVVGFHGGVAVRRNAATSPTSLNTTRPSGSAIGEGPKAKPASQRKAPQTQSQSQTQNQTLQPPPSLAPNSMAPDDVLRSAPARTVGLGEVNTPAKAKSAGATSASSPSQSQSNSARTWTKRPAEDTSSSPSKRPALASQSNTSTSSPASQQTSLKRPATTPLSYERPGKVPRIDTPPARSSFTRPPTVIPAPTQSQRVPAPTSTPLAGAWTPPPANGTARSVGTPPTANGTGTSRVPMTYGRQPPKPS